MTDDSMNDLDLEAAPIGDDEVAAVSDPVDAPEAEAETADVADAAEAAVAEADVAASDAVVLDEDDVIAGFDRRIGARHGRIMPRSRSICDP